MSSPLKHAVVLLGRAKDDLFVVRRLCLDADAPQWVIGFHAQQAVEKAFKAVLTKIGIPYPRTHNLVMLRELLKAAATLPSLDTESLSLLMPFGVMMRYEDVQEDDAPLLTPVECKNMAVDALAWAEAQLAS